MGLFQSNPNFFLRVFVSLAWLLEVAIYNYLASDPIISIFPYLMPVIFISWYHDAKWGIAVAAFATLSAMPANYVGDYTQTELTYAGILTYAQLTGAAIGFALAKRIHTYINPT